ncbi:glycosyltransferase [Cnuibacter physcomitrellae]|uniref:glycosyltransferase n=1 Tax=Cnuibacter physcomitrellae TaxID=1619308 RepID=UPI00217592BE|nr:glycosyltransferase [Cnuibacter physcomitrellae]MCS5496116.1 glycosyltransferase [Cnuibacter physcomitrellae]
MHVAHVVTYISSDAAFGGPVSVALGQAKELASRGHQVDVWAGWDGSYVPQIPGVRFRLFRVARLSRRSFAGLIAPRLLGAFWRERSKYDAVHVHLARDLISLPAALLVRHSTLVVQTHGMIIPDGRISVRVIDFAVRRVMRGARAIALTDTERAKLVAVTRGRVGHVSVIGNGVDVTHMGVEGVQRSRNEVLFLARLNPRKNVLGFAEAARQILRTGKNTTFAICGPDEGQLTPLTEFLTEHGMASSVRYEGAIAPQDVGDRLASSTVFVLPSRNEPFPMTVLEALASGTPVVIDPSCEISDRLMKHDAAVVTDGTNEGLAAAINLLLDNAAERTRLATNGRIALQEEFDIRSVVRKLEVLYR